MATLQRASLPKHFANFTNSTAGLDLTLRLIHALVIVAAEVSSDVDIVKTSLMANLQIGLARRYLRFFCFIDCFHNVFDLLTGTTRTAGTLPLLFDLIESSCLGLYLIVENTTMLHDMNLWLVPWYKPVLVEANKFWFYAIAASIARTIYTIFTQPSSKPKRTHAKKKSVSEKDVPGPPRTSDMVLLRKLVVDCLDLALPASFIGWLKIEDVKVGAAMTLSTLLAWPDLWAKYQ